MTLLNKTPDKIFNQQEYNNTFFYCESNHPFIAFTTCFCPLCEARGEITDSFLLKEAAEKALNELEDTYYELVGKVSAVNPELLI